MTVHNAAIDRIRKLMALTVERGASEHEAALASEHVQRLLAEHNLSMAAVEATGAASTPGGKRVREEGVGSRQVYKWQRTLMETLAKLNYCKAFTRFKTYSGRASIFDGYDLIGRVDNVATTRHMFEYLLQTIERLARDDVDNDPTQFFTRYAHSFKQGCADRLVLRLRLKQEEIVEQQERDAKEAAARARHPSAAPSNLPAVILRDFVQDEHDLNNDLEQKWEPGTTARRRREQEEASAKWSAAREARRVAALARGLNEGEASWAAVGYSDDRARELAAPVRGHADRAQRRKRQEREDNENRRFWQRQHREASHLDQRGYRKGQSAGDDVSLNR